MSLMASLVTTSRMQQCFNVLIDIYHEFLLLFYCCVLLEIKLTTTATTYRLYATSATLHCIILSHKSHNHVCDNNANTFTLTRINEVIVLLGQTHVENKNVRGNGFLNIDQSIYQALLRDINHYHYIKISKRITCTPLYISWMKFWYFDSMKLVLGISLIQNHKEISMERSKQMD